MNDLLEKLQKIQQETDAKKNLEDEMQLQELKYQLQSTQANPFDETVIPRVNEGFRLKGDIGDIVDNHPYTKYSKLKELMNKKK